MQPGEGMHKLVEAGNNALVTIKSTDCVTADSILIKTKKAAADLKKRTGMDEKPKFNNRTEAKVEADVHNYAIQEIIGTKVPPRLSRPSLGPLSRITYSNTLMASQKGSTNIVKPICLPLLPPPQNVPLKKK